MQELSYGAVMILKGRYKGKVGYYDDEEGDKAIVYLGMPCLSSYVEVKLENIVNVPSFSCLHKDGKVYTY